MNIATAAALTLTLALSAASSAFATDAPAKNLTPQQQRMKDCNGQATDKKGEERRAFMSTCLKGAATTASAPEAVAQPAAKKKSKASHAAAH